ncbi:glycoside hydrolase family 30 protein [Flavobacterium subsaxonicum]|uniref:Beta-glycosidase n=1 Tax=Flavobacterium subsaxonicum WB 4.1-42 = DSM 21790 TaxID=1121898 RepID=A0A0A2ML29_9FLAO|nr:glycoside hydrolase family 30 beta sandwich domain-containing protein [Flavobacterium subsaxonicum]KGO92271.1 beta-glycosidase [Flavobacterium subsaxonicum WB 4.1-42 = DSM 21790]
MKKTALYIIAALSLTACSKKMYVKEWVATTEASAWKTQNTKALSANGTTAGVEIYTDKPLQSIDGFGSCFNELGWTSLSALNEADRTAIMKELYEPNTGANFTIGRMPVGANDFSRDWYSYDEVEGDYQMKSFSIANDRETLIPFIKSATAYNPGLNLWASPWSPPQWMKYNKHYALAKVPSVMEKVDNELQDNQVGKEGTDMFIQTDRNFEAYALYFKRFVESYKAEGITISMVMPQNEFNSAQWYPSCTWTPEGLSNFVSYLGPEMDKLGVKVFFGTLERPKAQLFEDVYNNPKAGKYLKGVGVQWAGKEAVVDIHKTHPDLKIYQSEHECGDGKNNWDYTVYSWDLMKHYLLNGANAYLYWNTSLLKGGVSRWGWRQNSLVTVDADNKTYAWNHEYYLMKHLSHYVKPGATLLQTSSAAAVNHRNDVLGWWEGDLSSNADNLLAFKNPDGTIAVIIYNNSDAEKQISLSVSGKKVTPTLAAKSFNTFLIK